MSLDILILTIPKRKDFLHRLLVNLENQIGDIEGINILLNSLENATIGYKRNQLLQSAQSDYVCFIDDDDNVAPNYIAKILPGIFGGYDCCSLKGVITDDGKNPRLFTHSLKYTRWFEQHGQYFRPPNHLNVIKTSLAQQVFFPENNHGEDRAFSDQLNSLGLLKTEYWIEETLYAYEHRSKK